METTQLLEEVRRRVETATNTITRVRWMVLMKLLTEGLSFDQAGQIVDEGGNLFVYFIGDHFCPAVESGDSILPHIHVDRAEGRNHQTDPAGIGWNEVITWQS